MITEEASRSACVGHFELGIEGDIRGWGICLLAPERPLYVNIIVDGEKTVSLESSLPRPDVTRLYPASRLSGFTFRLPQRFKSGRLHLIEVVSEDGCALGPQLTYQWMNEAQRKYPKAYSLNADNSVVTSSSNALIDEGVILAGSNKLVIVFSAISQEEIINKARAEMAVSNPYPTVTGDLNRLRSFRSYKFLKNNAYFNPVQGCLYADTGEVWSSLTALRNSSLIANDQARIRNDKFSIRSFSGRYIVFSTSSRNNYFHWHLDNLASLFAMRQEVRQGWSVISGPLTPIQRQTASLIANIDIELTQSEVVRFDVVAGACNMDCRGMRPDANVRGMFDHISSNVPLMGNLGTTSRIFVSRADASTRRLINEDALWSSLSDLGFTRVVLSDLTYFEQVNVFRSSKIIIASHGAGLTNIGFCLVGAKIVEICPVDYQNGCFRSLALSKGLSHDWFLTGTLTNFVVDPKGFISHLRSTCLADERHA